MRTAGSDPDAAGSEDEWSALVDRVGVEVVRFQEAANAVDTAAAAVLAINRGDLPCITLLLVGGPATKQRIAQTLDLPIGVTRDVLARLEIAGYVRPRRNGDEVMVELTEHAHEWIARLWEPLRECGRKMFARYSVRQLSMIAAVLRESSEIQEAHATALRRWLKEPAAPRRSHKRGGLSPASLRRVQIFVEANLDRPLRTAELARCAELSVSHFARAFRVSAGATPRSYIERRRIERARKLIEETDRSLADIASATGFATQSHLTTAFRKATGFTPAVHRRSRATAPHPDDEAVE